MLRRSLGVLLISACAVGSSHAWGDRLVFGTFRSADNAANWAAKLRTLLDIDVQVMLLDRDGSQLHRVLSSDLEQQALNRLRRRASAAGIANWQLVGGEPQQSAQAPAAGAEAVRETAQSVRPGTIPRAAAPNPVDSPTDALDQQTAGPRQVDTTQPVPAEPSLLRSLGEADLEWDLGLQTRTFANSGVYGQDRFEASLSVEPEYYRGWDNDSQSITFSPFLRFDSADSERTHGDIRDLFYSRVGPNWDLHVGVKRVFWGVTEFHHLVDIINQTDLVENIDTEDKLGQPLVQLSLVRDWGIIDLYALPGFRERTFPGTDGRVRLPFKVLDDATYESAARRKRVDAAVRWSHHMGPFEVGVHHFTGTSRDPLLQGEFTPGGEFVLRPHYPVIDQTGIDAQAFYGDWAFKLEGISRSGFGDRYMAANIGFERTLVGAFGSRADLGLVAEYMFDERDEDAVNTLFEHDIALGGRLHLNDFADTQALLGVIFDTDNDEYFLSLEASRRLSDTWQLSLEARLFGGGKQMRRNTPLSQLLSEDYKTAWLQQDDYLQVEFKKFF